MPIDPALAPAVPPLLSRILNYLFSGARLRVDATATADVHAGHGPERKYLSIAVKVFNLGKPVTVRRAALVARPNWFGRLRGGFDVADEVEETSFSFHRGATEVIRRLPCHVATGDFHAFKFTTTAVWPPSQLSQYRLAVWHAYSKRPVLAEVSAPKTMRVQRGAFSTTIEDAP